MIVDVHTHCLQPDHISDAGHRADRRAGYPPMQPLTFARYAEEMAVVDRAIVFGVRGLATGVRSPNEFTAEWVRHDPDKLIGFMAIDPMEDDHMEQIEQGLELGLRGIKIYPMLGRYDPSDPTNFPMFEKAQRLGLPVPFSADTESSKSGKRCRNARLVASGYEFEYPSFREGYGAVIADLAARGKSPAAFE